MSIAAIPCNYKGVRYKSKLETKWAIYLDKCVKLETAQAYPIHPDHKILSFHYEPHTFRNSSGHTYTPDFAVHTSKTNYILEIKPKFPSPQYLHYKWDFMKGIDTAPNYEFLICVGSFYKGTRPQIYYVSDNLEEPDHLMDSYIGNAEAASFADRHRFDI